MYKMNCDKGIQKRNNLQKYAETREWVENQQEQNDNGSCYEEEISQTSSAVEESTDNESDCDSNFIKEKELETETETTSKEISLITESLKEMLSASNSTQTVGNVKIENSTGVHIGNVTNINGNIQIIHTCSSYRKKRQKRGPQKSQVDIDEHEEQVQTDAFMCRTKFKVAKGLCTILPRHTWLAQHPMEEYKYMEEPVPCVVISHTATESSEKQAINIRTIRDIQCFHIESRGWSDIAYNFLIGCDGNVYEGRGWGVIGAHTMGYNSSSIGISFIGCFMRELPSKAALSACKYLLKKGVQEGHLSKEYKLVTHAQCRSTESPGRRLKEELETWENFYKIEDEEEE